jgi:hypothetical protein
MQKLAELLAATGRVEEAESLAREALEIISDALPTEAMEPQFARCSLVRILAARGRCHDAEAELLAVRSDNPLVDRVRRRAAGFVADCFETAGANERAARWRAEAAPPAGPSTP